jgi:hypothetical protein
MLIQIQHSDNRFDFVEDKRLQELIETKEIIGFRRSSGWVTIGYDPIRKIKRDMNSRLSNDFGINGPLTAH